MLLNSNKFCMLLIPVAENKGLPCIFQPVFGWWRYDTSTNPEVLPFTSTPTKLEFLWSSKCFMNLFPNTGQRKNVGLAHKKTVTYTF